MAPKRALPEDPTKCRYPSKKCTNNRAVKRTGGLHSFCEMHRANANRNQRRVDMRKRMLRKQKRGLSMSSSSPQSPTPAMPPFDDIPSLTLAQNDTPTSSALFSAATRARAPASVQPDAQYEPLHTPTTLLDEDISLLKNLFVNDTTSAPPSSEHCTSPVTAPAHTMRFPGSTTLGWPTSVASAWSCMPTSSTPTWRNEHRARGFGRTETQPAFFTYT